MGKNQFSYFFCRGYFNSPEEIDKAIEKLGCRHYAYICHDRDIATKDTETLKKGEIKKAHWHININLISARTRNVVKKAFLEVNENCGITAFEMKSPNKTYDYLTHQTAEARKEGKVEYLATEIYTDSVEFWTSRDAEDDCKKGQQDIMTQFLDDVLELGYCPKTMLTEYIKLGHRDFIFNYRRVLLCVCDILNLPENPRLLFLTPEDREDYFKANEDEKYHIIYRGV